MGLAGAENGREKRRERKRSGDGECNEGSIMACWERPPLLYLSPLASPPPPPYIPTPGLEYSYNIFLITKRDRGMVHHPGGGAASFLVSGSGRARLPADVPPLGRLVVAASCSGRRNQAQEPAGTGGGVCKSPLGSVRVCVCVSLSLSVYISTYLICGLGSDSFCLVFSNVLESNMLFRCLIYVM